MTHTSFSLHPRLQADCLVIGQLPLSLCLLMNDQQFPWLILVPQRPALTEIYQLDAADRLQLLDESCHLATVLTQLYAPDKLNIAAIGNLVPQLHLHHVVRFTSDCAWPAPVWGKQAAKPYDAGEAAVLIDKLQTALKPLLID
jgi:diadenosine tetraphosphate (Ap4A) HIT family hydrolase